MMQSPVMSLTEAVANVAVGYGVAVVVQIGVFPLFGFWPTIRQNLTLGAVFTGVSLLRSYVLRRLFEHWRLWRERQNAAGP
jgi:hypothetical protein